MYALKLAGGYQSPLFFFVAAFVLSGCSSPHLAENKRPPYEEPAPQRNVPRPEPNQPIEFDSDKNFETVYFGIRTSTCFDLQRKQIFARVESFLTTRPSPASGVLNVGDRIIGYNGVSIRDATQLSRMIESTLPNSTSDFTVLREGKQLSFRIRGTVYQRAARTTVKPPEYPPECK